MAPLPGTRDGGRPAAAAACEGLLGAQLTGRDRRYLQSEAVGRQLVELGFRGSGDVLRREESEDRAAAAAPQQSLASVGKELKDNFLRALAEREEANRTGKMSSIIFIRDRNSRRQEVSAYIDYAHRLTTDDFEVYFSGKKKLLPRSTDLRYAHPISSRNAACHFRDRMSIPTSFYNWDRNVSTSNSSPNYQVIAENACGLLFENRNDRKIINVDPKAYSGDNTTRTPVETYLYLHVVIYDHIIRKGT